jgi:hypothetical protein
MIGELKKAEKRKRKTLLYIALLLSTRRKK